MPHSASRSRRSPADAMAGRNAERALLMASALATWDDRVSESIFDVDDERATVEMIMRGAHSHAS
ncbi:MAG TPA: hypothetical protein VN667_04455 [Burkholderiales bacterium]|nr:hypothetical protein [Burkholderiales bacterium]